MTPTQIVKAKLNLRYEPILFTQEYLANSYAQRCIKTHFVMLGDNGYWVSCFADAVKLEQAGYEVAKS